MDIMLKMAKGQGYVPEGCTLPGPLVMGLINSGEDPCIGCNQSRSICGGRPKQERRPCQATSIFDGPRK